MVRAILLMMSMSMSMPSRVVTVCCIDRYEAISSGRNAIGVGGEVEGMAGCYCYALYYLCNLACKIIDAVIFHPTLCFRVALSTLLLGHVFHIVELSRTTVNVMN
jgi:hypothetical protein